MAYDPAWNVVHVACTSGELVTLPAAGGAATRSVHVDIDLRDVLVFGDRVFVTRFKSAELLELAQDGSIISRKRPGPVTGPFQSNFSRAQRLDANTFEAAVAWRAVLSPDGSVAMLHQRDQVTPIALSTAQPGSSTGGGAGAGPTPLPPLAPGVGGSAYGSGGTLSCDSIVRSSVAKVTSADVTSGPVLAGVTLAVDAAISPDGSLLAVGVAGSFNDLPGMSPRPVSVVVMPTALTFDSGMGTRCMAPGFDMRGGTMIPAGQVIAVAFDGQGRLVVQTREPNHVLAFSNLTTCIGCEAREVDVDLGGESRRSTGHDLFHTNAGAGLACASCHPGGGDDGMAWNFQELGPRRTQLFNMGIRDTLPLHWDGELPSFTSLIEEVFERRMGGLVLPAQQMDAMSDWLDTLHPNAPMRSAKDPAAMRGRVLFESTVLGCTSCHNGTKLTNNANVNVGTGGLFQVPSLIGVAYHQPYLHTGCAQTLRQRFDPACGGAGHGNTAGLTEDKLADLVAYLESL